MPVNKTTFTRFIRLLLLSAYFFNPAVAQKARVNLTFAELLQHPEGMILRDTLWYWHPGDNTNWKNAVSDSSGWQSAHTDFGSSRPLTNWKGIGWFQTWISADKSLVGKMLGIRVNQKGASEIFYDGKKSGALGRVGSTSSQMKAARATYQIFPFAVQDTLPHLLAVRYSNFSEFYPDFVGFQIWAGDFETMAAARHDKFRNYDFLLLSIVAQFTLALLHLLLFLFYRKQKLNLYYSLFVFSMLTSLYLKYVYAATEDPTIQPLVNLLFLCFIPLVALSGAVLVYSVGNPKLPKKKVIAICVISAFLIIYNISDYPSCECKEPDAGFFYGNIFLAIVLLDGLFSVIKAIKNRKPGVWLIATGMFLTLLFTVLFGGNIFGLTMDFQKVLTIMAVALLILPVFFSIYLALDFARINHNLEQQLEHNTKLSALNLSQEQEKTRFLTEQSDKLEKTVEKRTAQVREQARKLEEMDAVKSRLFVNLTHEFRTPLTLILGPARQILSLTTNNAVRLQANLIRENADHLLLLINQLLDLSKLEAGKMELSAQPVNLVAITEKIVGSFQSLSRANDVTLCLKQAAPAMWVIIDPAKFSSILHNLLSNAIKFSNPGGEVSLLLELTGDSDQLQIHLNVTDNGIGIMQDRLPFIFDRFYQVDSSATRQQEGTGIGLALTKELLELMNGNISITSEPGVGTSADVYIPGYPALENFKSETEESASDPAAPASILPVHHGDLMRNKPLLLIIEDHHQLRSFLGSLFTDQYSILVAANGAEGLDLAREHVPELVITDLMLPVLDGYQLSHELKRNEPTSHIPILMLTARADMPSKIEGWEAGADGYISKPFDNAEILALAANLIDTRQKLARKFSKEIQQQGKTSLPSIEQVFLNRVKVVIEEHLDNEQLSVDFLAEEIGLSRTQLHRKLKGIIDQSPGELIRVIRLQRAWDLLKQNAGTISEIAYMVGFGNPANFSTSFSKHFGYAPSELKQQL